MLNIKIEKLKREQSFLSKEKMRELYISLHKGETIEIPEGLYFDRLECYDFLNSVMLLCEKGQILTNNIKFINVANSILREHENKDQRVLVIDNHNFFHRTFHAVPRLLNDQNQHVSVLKATINLIKWILSTQDRFTHIVFSSEGGNLKRKEETLNDEKQYKGNRSKTDPILKEEIALTEKVLEELGFNVLRVYGYEADDVLASLAKKYPVTAFTSDKDAYQLFVYEGFEIMNPKTKEIIGPEGVYEKFGVSADNFIDYQAIVGDTADNIPGVKGMGAKAAKELVNRYSTLENIYKNIEHIGLEEIPEDNRTKQKLKTAENKQQKLLNSKESAFKSRELCRLNTDLFDKLVYDPVYFSPTPYKNMEKIFKSRLKSYGINY